MTDENGLSLTDQIRDAIQRDPRPQTAIVRATGGVVSSWALSRFLNGKGLTTANLDALARALKLRVHQEEEPCDAAV